MRCRRVGADILVPTRKARSEFIADPTHNLVVAQLLLQSNRPEIQDGYRIDEGFGLELRIPVLDTREPVVREGIVESCSHRPADPRIAVADRDAGSRNGRLS